MNIYQLFNKYKFVLLLILVTLFAYSCKQSPTSSKKAATPIQHHKISFKPVHGIAFTEVRRQYENGLGFNNYGYHLEPEWQVTFLSDDSVRIYSLVLKRFIREWVAVDHDSVATVAHSWLRVLKLSPDSMLFKVLYVKNQTVDNDSKGQIYMTLYSNNYIKNVLHTTAAQLQKPPCRDSLFIKQKVKAATENYNNAFAAYEPATLTSKVPQVKITKKEVTRSNDLEDVTVADNYLSPTFDVTIHKAYNNFDYNMQIIVDEKGTLHFVKSLNLMYDEVENRLKVMKGIVDGYLTYYIKTIPGKTLGMAHASRILVHVKGIQD